jgi:hypothetical protein
MANETTSAEIRNCYLLLAKQYGALAQMEVEYAAGSEPLGALEKGN